MRVHQAIVYTHDADNFPARARVEIEFATFPQPGAEITAMLQAIDAAAADAKLAIRLLDPNAR